MYFWTSTCTTIICRHMRICLVAWRHDIPSSGISCQITVCSCLWKVVSNSWWAWIRDLLVTLCLWPPTCVPFWFEYWTKLHTGAWGDPIIGIFTHASIPFNVSVVQPGNNNRQHQRPASWYMRKYWRGSHRPTSPTCSDADVLRDLPPTPLLLFSGLLLDRLFLHT